MSIEVGYHRGYKLVEEDDGSVLVKKSGKTIVSCENEHEAYNYIDSLHHHDLTRSISLKYCVVIRYPGSSREYYVGKNSIIPTTSAKEKDVRLFASKSEAQKIYQSKIKGTLSPDHFYNIKLYR